MGWVFLLGFITALVLVAKLTIFILSTVFGIFGRVIGFGAPYGCDQGEYAVIVGATGVLGKEYSKELASMGYNLVLISRKIDKLKKIADNIVDKSEGPIEVKMLEADFTDLECYKTIEEKLNSIRFITVLVNCTSIDISPRFFWEIPREIHRNMVFVNVLAPLLMMQMLMPRFIKQGRGIVINIGSHSGDFRYPRYSTFSASKSFIHTLSETVSTEAFSSGVYVQTVKPCFVDSRQFNRYHRSTVFLADPKSVVVSSVLASGIETSTYGDLKHKFTGLFFNTLVFLFGHRLTTAIIYYFHYLYFDLPEEESVSQEKESSKSNSESLKKPLSASSDPHATISRSENGEKEKLIRIQIKTNNPEQKDHNDQNVQKEVVIAMKNGTNTIQL